MGDGTSSSSTDSDYSDCDDVPLKLGSSHIHFVHNDEVFSMYRWANCESWAYLRTCKVEVVFLCSRCLLHPGESTISAAMFARPLDCAVFLLAGGHFAAGIFKK